MNNIDKNELAKFIEDSVSELRSSPNEPKTFRFPLDEDLAVYIGWRDGFESDNGYYGYDVCGMIGTMHEDLWADYDFVDMPYNPETGDVWDTELTSPDASDADWFINVYKDIRTSFENGDIVIPGATPIYSKTSVKASDGVSDEAYEVADIIVDKLKDKDYVSYDEYLSLYDEAVKQVFNYPLSPEQEEDIYSGDFSTDVRILVSMNGGYGTDYSSGDLTRDLDSIELSKQIKASSNPLDELWDKYIEYGICSEETLRVVTSINGYNEETMNDILYATTGYRSWEQYTESEGIEEED